MRIILPVMLVCACSGSGGDVPEAIDAAPVVDADPCSVPPENAPVAGCVHNGLAGLALDGAWTLTGTVVQFGGTPMPYTETRYMKREGTGRCGFAISSSPITAVTADPAVYIDDTIARYSTSGYYPHSHMESWSLCVSDSDGSLVYKQQAYVSMPPQDQRIDGVLTR